MTISYPLTPPTTPGFRGVQMMARAAVAAVRSPFSFESQIQINQGQIWQGQVDFPSMDRVTAEPWLAFLLSLNGMQGTFLLGIDDTSTPRGTATGTPLVNGASQSGQSLITDGWTINITGILKAGDMIQLGTGLNTHLHKVLADANSNGSGQATLDIWPRLRVSPADNAPIVVNAAVGLWRLAVNDVQWDLANLVRYGLSFPVIEAI